MLSQAIAQGIDAESLERLVGLQERILDRERQAEFSRAKRQAQTELPLVVHDRTGVQKATYATYRRVVEAVRPVLNRHGLSDTYDMEPQANGNVAVWCILTHDNGHSERTRFDVPTGSGAGMSEQQKAGSAVSHAKRYALLLALGITTADEVDNDAAEPQEPITAEQIANIEALLTEVGADRGLFMKFAKVEKIEELPAHKYAGAVQAIEARRGR